MKCIECSRRETCDPCKSAELDKLPEEVKFSRYNFKPIEKDGEKQ
jgi:hypothetical protein